MNVRLTFMTRLSLATLLALEAALRSSEITKRQSSAPHGPASAWKKALMRRTQQPSVIHLSAGMSHSRSLAFIRG